MALVREFHEKFGLPIGSGWFDGGERRLREALLSEEHGEYLEAEDRDEFEAIADALGDMVSVIYGTALSYGIDLDAVLAEIHRSNMTKERDPAMQYPAKNIVKGEGYEPPNLRPILERRSPEPEADRCPNCGMLDSERPALPAEGDTGASSAESTSRPEKGTQADLGSPPASTGSEGFESQGRVSAQGEDVEPRRCSPPRPCPSPRTSRCSTRSCSVPDQHTAPDAEPQEREFTVWRCPAGHVCNAPSDPAIEVVECGECGGDGVTWHRPVTVVPKSALTAVERRADSLKLRLLDEADKRKAQAARANAAERRADRAEDRVVSWLWWNTARCEW